MVKCQTIPVNVVIVDGSDCVSSKWSSWPNAIYIHRPNIVLGASRNLAMKVALEKGADYIALWDDDDFYQPWHLEKAIELLTQNKEAKAVGSSITQIYFKQYNELWECGPYAVNHSLEPALVVRAELARINKFDETDVKGLGAPFLDHYEVPLVQMPYSHILIAHETNTVGKEMVRKVPSRYLAKKVVTDIPEILSS